MTALSAFAAIFAATGGGPRLGHRDPEPLRLSHVLHPSWTSCPATARSLVAGRLLSITLAISSFMFRLRAVQRPARRCAVLLLAAFAGVGLSIWAFPVDLGPADLVQDRARRARLSARSRSSPTLDNYREVIFGSSSILPNLWSSLVGLGGGHGAHDVFAVPRRLRHGAAALSGQARLRLLRAGDADAAAGRA